ncbi:T7SS effector LXG polymorphic toxin [Xylocopilactobacillus apicola]|uniref:LXG domain-containing protein n=1 Tax=Xylocopilactobacillus apicola TaxID=2932184 RepID=A0AAU9DAF8_9LACO|nr:T7SS effector LXG polymorphic toxin [Xylocopilactobacillus apicola]BDR59426.1 hypothetical protein XA3_18670 [Xylocopilactobacillus apicola]
MGLIYSSSDSESLIKALGDNLSKIKSTVDHLKSGSQHVVSYISGSSDLSGNAYEKGTNLFRDCVIPTINLTTEIIRSIEKSFQKYKSANEAIKDEGYLKEDNIKQQIREKESLIDRYESQIASSQVMSIGNSDALISYQKMLYELIDELKRDISKLNKKLEKLYRFNSATSSLFTNSLNDLKTAMQGVLALKKTIVKPDGSYQFPIGVDSSLFEAIKSRSLSVSSEDEAIRNAIENMPLNMDTDQMTDWVLDGIEEHGLDFFEVLDTIQNWSGKGTTMSEAFRIWKKSKAYLGINKLYLDSKRNIRMGNGEQKPKNGGKFLLGQYSDASKHKNDGKYLHREGKTYLKNTGIDLVDYHYSRLPDGSIDWKQFRAGGMVGFKEAINPFNDFKGWKGASNLTKVGKGLGIAGTAFTVVNDFNDNIDLSHIDTKSVVNFATDVAVDFGASASAVALGTAIGTTLLPGAGTVAGAIAGIVIDVIFNAGFGNPPKSAVDYVKSGAKGLINGIGKMIKGFGNLAGGLRFGYGH